MQTMHVMHYINIADACVLYNNSNNNGKYLYSTFHNYDMSQCALQQSVEDFFGLHIMAHWQPSSLQS
jgi:hypothetical protein